uniref:Abnormal spindle-like microcephaly-associated protein ASH domain-containing protein n=1 Tax=Terrapene triunguis TaxID=2587831 RepID=A0A674IVM1_9SAUR
MAAELLRRGAAAACGLSPAESPGRRRRRWAGREEEDPAVLTLTHFSRPPFLSFGSLRPGASCTRLLAVDNPNPEEADVVIDRFPAPSTGFSLERRRFLIQSGERIFISITWTPLEEGKVRELVTFIVNGIVKHQAVLLGVAEQPLKKKVRNSLWDAIKKKNTSEGSLKTLRQAVLVIQRHYRAYCMKKEQRTFYLKTKAAALVLQAAFRGMRVRKQLWELNEAATIIQATYKSYVVKTKYAELKAMTIMVQRRYRAVVQAKYQKQEYLSLKNAVVKIQAIYRGIKVRRQIHCMHQAAISIQAMFKMHRINIRYRAVKLAATVIQIRYRAFCQGRVERKKYLMLQRSSLVLQAAYRGMKVRRKVRIMHQSATIIQSYYQMHRQQKAFKKLSMVTKQIQQWYRACKERNVQVHKYRIMKRAILCIQAAFRGMKTRRHLKMMHVAAAFLQRRVRSFLKRKKYISLRTAAVMIQRKYRATAHAKQQHQEYLHLRKAAVTIQSAYRGFVVRKKMQQMHRAATVIQAALRMYRMCISYQSVKFASITIQQHYQAYKEGKLQQYSSMKKAATCIQRRRFKTFKERQRYLSLKAAAVVLQRRYRALILVRWHTQEYLSFRRAVIRIQSLYRGIQTRRNIQHMHLILDQKQKKRLLCFSAAAYHHLSAIKIQRAFRIHLVLKHAQMQISSVLCIQRWFRARLQQQKSLQDHQKIIKIQRMVRRWLKQRNEAATTIQRAVRKFLFYKQRRKLKNGIIKFQALWRGYSWRKKNDTAKTKALRRSLEMANKESKEENKLCNRTAVAIDYLLKYKHISYILAALKHLEVVTRLSPLCCENMAQSGAIFTIFILIRNCNRSIPCMEVIKYSVQVLLNVSKYERTTQAVYEVENSVDTLLDLLQMYREKAGDKTSEKGGSIFTKTCCLLAILLKDSKRASDIRSTSRAASRIHSLYRLTARKHKMDAERTLSKHKMHTSMSGSFFVPVTPVRTKVVSRIKPDWVLRKDNMQEIVDPLQAIRMVMDTLGTAYH